MTALHLLVLDRYENNGSEAKTKMHTKLCGKAPLKNGNNSLLRKIRQ
jgi:hypothetical protein